MKKPLIVLAVVIVLATQSLACSIPMTLLTEQSPDAMRTEVAMTIAAALTSTMESIPATATLASETATPTAESTVAITQTDTAVPTNTLGPTATVAPTNTNTVTPPTAIPCNAVSFVKDVTYPDGASVMKGSNFIKTWRLRNVGTCTWNSAYNVVYISGDRMNGPEVFPLTSGVVAPNQMIDVSVTLKAPMEIGNHQGNWALRSPEGVIFQLSTGPFWVKIKSVNLLLPTIPPVLFPVTIEAPLNSAVSGAIKSSGIKIGYPNIGDDSTNVSYQGFVAFDISGIPDGATITKVEVDLTDYDTLGSPWTLGCLRIYPQSYGDLDVGDYFSGVASGAVARFCNSSELNDIEPQAEMIGAIQAAVGTNKVKFRIQFNENATDGDGVGDMVRFGEDIRLIITYTP